MREDFGALEAQRSVFVVVLAGLGQVVGHFDFAVAGGAVFGDLLQFAKERVLYCEFVVVGVFDALVAGLGAVFYGYEFEVVSV